MSYNGEHWPLCVNTSWYPDTSHWSRIAFVFPPLRWLLFLLLHPALTSHFAVLTSQVQTEDQKNENLRRRKMAKNTIPRTSPLNRMMGNLSCLNCLNWSPRSTVMNRYAQRRRFLNRLENLDDQILVDTASRMLWSRGAKMNSEKWWSVHRIALSLLSSNERQTLLQKFTKKLADAKLDQTQSYGKQDHAKVNRLCETVFSSFLTVAISHSERIRSQGITQL